MSRIRCARDEGENQQLEPAARTSLQQVWADIVHIENAERKQNLPLVVRAKLLQRSLPISLPDLGYQNNQMGVLGLAFCLVWSYTATTEQCYLRYCCGGTDVLLESKTWSGVAKSWHTRVNVYLWRARACSPIPSRTK